MPANRRVRPGFLGAAASAVFALAACGGESTAPGDSAGPLPWHYVVQYRAIDSVIATTSDSILALGSSGDLLLSSGGDFRLILNYHVLSNPPLGQAATLLRSFSDTVHWRYTYGDSTLAVMRDSDPAGVLTEVLHPVPTPLSLFVFHRHWRMWKNTVSTAVLTADRI